ncbi:hypothetical protein ACLKA6_016074 [Drosophila palustris]
MLPLERTYCVARCSSSSSATSKSRSLPHKLPLGLSAVTPTSCKCLRFGFFTTYLATAKWKVSATKWNCMWTSLIQSMSTARKRPETSS